MITDLNQKSNLRIFERIIRTYRLLLLYLDYFFYFIFLFYLSHIQVYLRESQTQRQLAVMKYA